MAEYKLKFLVIGENPEEIIQHFDLDTKVDPYPAFLYKNAGIYRQNMITTLKRYLKEDLDENKRQFMEDNLAEIESMTDDEYYTELTYGQELDENLNMLSTGNPNARFQHAEIATEKEAYPFILKDGTKAFSARLGDIDWEATKTDGSVYARTWDLIVKHAKVETEQDAQIYRNYDGLRHIAATFGTKEKYVAANTMFFTPYVATKEKGKYNWYVWDSKNFVDWILNFHKKFFSRLPDDTLITLYSTPTIY